MESALSYGYSRLETVSAHPSPYSNHFIDCGLAITFQLQIIYNIKRANIAIASTLCL